MKKTFYFNTGVRVFVMEYADMGKPKHYDATDKIINGQRHIPFDCEDVPEGASFSFACDNPNLYSEGVYIVREMTNTTMCSKYAYFKPPFNHF